MQEEYEKRMRERKNNKKFIDKMINNQAWKESYIKNKNDERPTYKVELGSGEYLSDIKERFFE